MQTVHRTARRRSALVRRRPLNNTAPKAVTAALANNVTLSGPVSFSALPLSTYRAPLSSGIDLQVQLQLSTQLVPSATTQTPQQVTIPADVAQALANWIVENPGQAALWGAGITIGVVALASWLDSIVATYATS